jgi:prolyl 4-hydroxylase
VSPKKGSAVLWPSVLNSDLTKIEPKTHHAALPVIKGRKFAANSWLHLYDYRTPNLWGCTGSFDS